MNHSALLGRAFDITRRYRVLWLFGILFALAGGGSRGCNGTGYNFSEADFRRPNLPGGLPADQAGRQWEQWFGQLDPGVIVAVIALCCLILLLLAIVALIVRYVARTALIRGVDQIEATGGAPAWREGLRLGWSNRAFRLWLLELIVGIPVALAVILLLAVAASPLLLLLTQNDAARTIGIVLTVMLGLLAILIVIIAAIVLSILGQFWSREIVLADRSIGAALTVGYAEVRRRVRDIGVLWLLMAGIQIGFTILLVPVVLLLLAIAALAGGGLGYAVYTLAHSVPWAIVVGLPIFLLILVVPLTLVNGLYETFTSTTWTLAYREVAPSRAV